MVVVAVALAAAAAVGLLGFRSSDASPGGVPEAVAHLTVSGTPTSRPVPPGFVGLSLEYTTIEAFAGTNPGAINPVFARLVRDLAPNGRPVVRIGGDSGDFGWVHIPGVKPPGGIRFTLGQRWVTVTRAMAQATRARLILGLNLEAGSRRLVAAQARLFRGVGRSALTAFELGNEPELFGAIRWYLASPGHPVFGRRHGYKFENYVREFTQYSKVLPRSVPLAGPATGGPRWIPRTAEFLAAEPRARLATLHLYPLHRCYVNQLGPTGPSIPNLLSRAASAGITAGVAASVAPAHALGAKVRVGEMNSVSCGGAPGVSDTFASALWSLDILFHLAQEGVDGVNFHTFVKAYYRPFSFRHVHGRWSANVAPMYYGLLAFNRAAPPGSRLLSVSAPSDRALRLWATRGPDHRTRVVVINTSPEESRRVEIKLPGASAAPATVQRLTAPSLGARSDVTLGGRAFAGDTTTGLLTGEPKLEYPRRSRSGVYRLLIPAGSAAILTR